MITQVVTQINFLQNIVDWLEENYRLNRLRQIKCDWPMYMTNL
jgi:hypothetical protein